jgi:hypothetical protein
MKTESTKVKVDKDKRACIRAGLGFIREQGQTWQFAIIGAKGKPE